MGDQTYVGSRVAEPLLARIFDLPKIRRADSPIDPIPWVVDNPIPMTKTELFSIERPESGAVYRRVNEGFVIRPKANRGGELLWFLNGRPLDSGQARRMMVGSGRHELLCLTANGEYALSRFQVH